MTEPKLTTLPSGMKLVTVDMPGLNSVTVLAMVGVGSCYEDPAKAGISHFLEHLPFKGTQNYPTSMAFAQAIDGVGGKYNAFTDKEYTGYWVKVGADKLPLALDMVSDLVLTAQLRPEDIDKERGVIIEEINMYEDQPQAKVGDVFEELVYAGSSLATPIIGSKETVGALQREDFLKHWDRWYDPSHVVVGIVGNIGGLEHSGSELSEMAQAAFSKGVVRKGGGEYADVKIAQNAPRINVVHKKTEQAHFHLGFPGVGRFDEDRYALNLLSTIAGGNSSSRLFNEIREKRGLAYYAYASADLNRDCGSFYAFEGVSLDKAQEAVKVTMEEFSKLLAGDITDEEVSRAKEYLSGKVALDLENSSQMANLMVEKVLFEGKVETVEQILAKYKQVTSEEVRAVAKRVIDFDRVNLAVIGPYQTEDFDFVQSK